MTSVGADMGSARPDLRLRKRMFVGFPAGGRVFPHPLSPGRVSLIIFPFRAQCIGNMAQQCRMEPKSCLSTVYGVDVCQVYAGVRAATVSHFFVVFGRAVYCRISVAAIWCAALMPFLVFYPYSSLGRVYLSAGYIRELRVVNESTVGVRDQES